MSRRLASKRDRYALSAASDHKCSLCRSTLTEGWHADHIIPWSVSSRTNVHEMQALCAGCNLKKGAKMSRHPLRSFQKKLVDIARGIAAGNGPRVVTADVTPGGGKTRGAGEFARALVKAGYADRVVWLSSSCALVEQAANAVPGWGLRTNTNELPLVKDPRVEIGYVGTYQSLVAHERLHVDHAKAHRVVLVADEFHHLALSSDGERGVWARAVERLSDHAVAVLAMSGTPYRHGDQRILFVNYPNGSPEPATVVYSRTDALDEGAKLKILPEWVDGGTDWVDERTGENFDTRTENPDERVKQVITWKLTGFLGFVDQAIDKGIRHWLSHRANNPRAQCIVVTRDQAVAGHVFDRLSQRSAFRSGLAISNAPSSRKEIRDFRERRTDLLVTVGMAYEGLDAPSTTHVICFRGFTSAPWLEQCADRATRIDHGNPAKHAAWLFLPGTPDTREAWQAIESAQRQYDAQELERKTRESGERGPSEGGLYLVGAKVDGSDLLVRAELVRDRYPWAEVLSDKEAAALADDVNWSTGTREPEPVYDPNEEKNLRKSIQRKANQMDYRNDLESGTTNKSIIRRFGRPRGEMGLTMLRQVNAWLDQIA